MVQMNLDRKKVSASLLVSGQRFKKKTKIKFPAACLLHRLPEAQQFAFFNEDINY